MKRYWLPVIALLLLTFAASAPAGERRITIATAGTSGALYPMGVAMAQVINQKVPGLTAAAEASAASLENLRNLAAGKVDWGISQNEVAFMAYSGQEKWKGRQVGDLRSLFGTLISWVQVFAPADSKFKSVADFRGKRIGVGAPGSGGEQAARKVLAFYGLTYDDIRPEFIPDAEMVRGLKDGTLDAFISTHPLRSAALMDLTSSMKVKLLPVAEKGFYQKYPYFARRDIPPKTYRGMDAAIATPTSRIVMYTCLKAGLSNEQIYALLTGLWNNAGAWTKVHPAVKRYTSLKLALVGLNVPLHPGAVKFYQDRGLEVPTRLR